MQLIVHNFHNRSRYCAFVSCLKPVLIEEGGLVSEFQQLEEVTKKLTKVTDEPGKLPAASEAVISDMTSGNVQGDGNGLTGPHFQTPPSSPSSLGSRKSSMCSISSAGSSGAAGQGSSPSHHPSVNNARLRSQVHFVMCLRCTATKAFIFTANVNLHISFYP